MGGLAFPARVTKAKDGSFIATSPDWRVATQGPTAADALRELSCELDRRVRAAVEMSRAHTGP